MKEEKLKVLKFDLIMLGVFIVLDSVQALIFNNRPLLSDKFCACDYVNINYIDKGVLVHHYVYTNGDEKSTFFFNKMYLKEGKKR